MKRTGRIDGFECMVRFVLGAVLLLVAMDYGWTVIGTGAVVLGTVAIATAIIGFSPADRVLARIAKR